MKTQDMARCFFGEPQYNGVKLSKNGKEGKPNHD
jgi:hypothetical protein